MSSSVRHAPALCPVCSGRDFSEVSSVFDDRYGNPEQFVLVRCLQCDHLMTSPQLRESDLPALYGTYYPRKSISSASVAKQAIGVASWWSRLLRWLAGTDNQGQYGVRAGERMLDIGSGSGLSLLEAQKLGAQAWGIEADPNVQPIARELGLRVHQGNLQDGPFPGIAFDLVVMNQVIEHIPQPDEILRAIRGRLAQGGRVVLVFPNIRSLWCKLSGQRWINWHIPYHLHHFNKETFARMAQRCGYRVVQTRTVTPNVWTILQVRASRNAAVLGTPSALWAIAAPSAVPQGDRSALSGAALRRIPRRLVLLLVLLPITAVNRLVDVFGWGDSLMVELLPVERS